MGRLRDVLRRRRSLRCLRPPIRPLVSSRNSSRPAEVRTRPTTYGVVFHSRTTNTTTITAAIIDALGRGSQTSIVYPVGDRRPGSDGAPGSCLAPDGDAAGGVGGHGSSSTCFSRTPGRGTSNAHRGDNGEVAEGEGSEGDGCWARI